MSSQHRSTTWNWWGLAFGLCFGTLCVTLILTGIVGETVWWTAAAMGLLAISSALNIRAISQHNRKVAKARATELPELPRQ